MAVNSWKEIAARILRAKNRGYSERYVDVGFSFVFFKVFPNILLS